jgi:hypothetical protein
MRALSANESKLLKRACKLTVKLDEGSERSERSGHWDPVVNLELRGSPGEQLQVRNFRRACQIQLTHSSLRDYEMTKTSVWLTRPICAGVSKTIFHLVVSMAIVAAISTPLTSVTPVLSPTSGWASGDLQVRRRLFGISPFPILKILVVKCWFGGCAVNAH